GTAGAGPAEPLEEGISPVDDLANPVAANRNSIHGLPSVVEREQGPREQRNEGIHVGNDGLQRHLSAFHHCTHFVQGCSHSPWPVCSVRGSLQFDVSNNSAVHTSRK